jgi:DNA-binding transcriptional regulator YbjK
MAVVSDITETRGTQRKNEILEAALRLIARYGINGVTHRAVAREASVSLSATTYYFESKESLLQEAFSHYAKTRLDDVNSLSDRFPSTNYTLEEATRLITDIIVEELEVNRDALIAEYEMVLELTRNSALKEVYQTWQAKLLKRLQMMTKNLGSISPEKDARIILAIMRGLQMESLSHSPEKPNHKSIHDSVHLAMSKLFKD